MEGKVGISSNFFSDCILWRSFLARKKMNAPNCCKKSDIFINFVFYKSRNRCIFINNILDKTLNLLV